MIVVGVDISVTHNVSFGDTTGKSESWVATSSTHGSDLWDTAHRTQIALHQFINGRPIAAVFYEEPMGKFRNPALTMTAGCVAAGCHAAVRAVFSPPPLVYPINISTWKKNAIGHGNATKEQIMAWALLQGFKPANQDEADALGVAFGGLPLISVQAAA